MEKDESKSLNKKQTYELNLTKHELVHLRDLFSILLPPDLKSTVSQMLATVGGRTMVESLLWNKINQLCAAADVPLGDDAPDFVVSYSGPPTLGIFELAAEEKPVDEDDDEDEPEEKEEKLLLG